MKKIIIIFALSCSVMLCGAGLKIKDNSTVAFMGDSITQFGHNNEGGYVNLVTGILKKQGLKIKVVKAGISGNKSNQMLARVQKHVIDRKADFLFLSCGVNDVWHGVRGVPLEQYKENMTAIVDKCQKAGITVCIMTATMIREDINSSYNKKLAAYNDFLRRLAAEKKCLLADTNAAMIKKVDELKKNFPGVKGNLLTTDGVHMAPSGDMMMAETLLKTVGVPEGKIDFNALPVKVVVNISIPCTLSPAAATGVKNTTAVKSHIFGRIPVPIAIFNAAFPLALKEYKNMTGIANYLGISVGK